MKVFVTIYTYDRYSKVVQVFRTRKSAEECRAYIARNNWSTYYRGRRPHDSRIADLYFDRAAAAGGDEYFEIFEEDVL